jgi:short subunit dehydrogenase-like uncharacterized protein
VSALLIYGVTGYSGELIARAAKVRGLRPILAGRDSKAVQALAKALKFEWRAFGLDAIDLSNISVVLHCAGPFAHTAQPMMAACIAAGVHYLDITGEIDVFAAAHALDAAAKKANVLLCPGVGFDVVPTDCMALMLKQKLPDATDLELAFDAEGGMSRGTAKTSIEGLAGRGRARVNGQLVAVPVAWKVRDFAFAAGRLRRAMSIPWGDVYTAFVSTGIPNITVYMSLPKATIALARRTRWLAPLLGLKPVQALLKRRVDARPAGPDADTRRNSRTYIYGAARAQDGREVCLQVVTGNGYEVTVCSALIIAQYVLDGHASVGYHTPAQLCGAELLLQLPHTSVRWIS